MMASSGDLQFDEESEPRCGSGIQRKILAFLEVTEEMYPALVTAAVTIFVWFQ
jgi:hypothetical protein